MLWRKPKSEKCGKVGIINYHQRYYRSPDIGSTFWIELAQADVSTEPGFSNQKLPPAANKQLPAAVEGTLLYIEDNIPNMRLMEVLIGKFDKLKLLSAGSAEEGIELARNTLPDLIILDLNLPGMSGLEALQILKNGARTSDIPVIALSAASMESDIYSGLNAGFDRYLTKPIDLDFAIITIVELLEEKKLAYQD